MSPVVDIILVNYTVNCWNVSAVAVSCCRWGNLILPTNVRSLGRQDDHSFSLSCLYHLIKDVFQRGNQTLIERMLQLFEKRIVAKLFENVYCLSSGKSSWILTLLYRRHAYVTVQKVVQYLCRKPEENLREQFQSCLLLTNPHIAEFDVDSKAEEILTKLLSRKVHYLHHLPHQLQTRAIECYLPEKAAFKEEGRYN